MKEEDTKSTGSRSTEIMKREETLLKRQGSNKEKIPNFLESKKKEINKLAEVYPEKKSLFIDYEELEKFDIVLVEKLLQNPDAVISQFEEALSDLKVPMLKTDAKFYVRFTNLPDANFVPVKHLASEHINKFITVEGIVNRIGDILPKVSTGKFVCNRCGNEMWVEQPKAKRFLTSPIVCNSCDRRDFRFVPEESLFIDIQRMEIQESLEILKGGEQARKVEIWTEEDMTDRVTAGDKVIVNGILRLLPPPKQKGTGSVYFRFLDANYIEPVEKEFEELDISEEDMKEILKLSKDPKIYDKLIDSIAPSIYGYREVKEAIVLQLFGGRHGKELPDGTHVRPDIHLLMIGDPGVAKSRILQYVDEIAPKSVYVSGKSTTAGGLTAIAERDEFAEGAWTLKAGALVIAGGGIACIDEFDKMEKADQSSMHEAMEQQTISVAKAGIIAKFRANTSILAASNPKFSRFDLYKPIGEQFDIPPTLLSVDKNEPIILKENGIIKCQKIGKIIDKYYCLNSDRPEQSPVYVDNIEVLAFDPETYKIEWKPVKYLYRHKINDILFSIRLDSGRSVNVTRGHSIYVFEDGEIKPKPSDQIKANDYVVIPKGLPSNTFNINSEINLPKEILKVPKKDRIGIFLHDVPMEVFDGLKDAKSWWIKDRKLPLEYVDNLTEDEIKKCTLKCKGGVNTGVPTTIPINSDLMRLLGYCVAEGSLCITNSSSHLMSLAFNAKEKNLVCDVKNISKRLFNHNAKITNDKNSTKVNIANKIIYLLFDKILNLKRGAKNKEIPWLVFNVKSELQKEFIKAYHNGDYCVTVSKKLSSDLLYLLLQNDVIASVHKEYPKKVTFPDGHSTISGPYYSLVDADKKVKTFKGVKWYQRIPLEPIKASIKELSQSNYKGNYRGKKRSTKAISGEKWWSKKIMNSNLALRVERLETLQKTMTVEDFTKICSGKSQISRTEREGFRCYLNRLLKKGLVERKKINRSYYYYTSEKGKKAVQTIKTVEQLLDSDLGFVKVREIKKVNSSSECVYDISVPGCENFIAGFGGVICHNSRFDLIFPIRDILDTEQDKKIADHILKMHKGQGELDEIKPKIEVELFKRYIAYARINIYPVLSDDSADKIKEYYTTLRASSAGGRIAATARQLEALVRLSEASAKTRMSGVVTISDVERAIELTNFVLREIATDETGAIDQDRIIAEYPKTARDRIHSIENIVRELCQEREDRLAPLEEILEKAAESKIDKGGVEKVLLELKIKGILFEPKNDKWKWVG